MIALNILQIFLLELQERFRGSQRASEAFYGFKWRPQGVPGDSGVSERVRYGPVGFRRILYGSTVFRGVPMMFSRISRDFR